MQQSFKGKNASLGDEKLLVLSHKIEHKSTLHSALIVQSERSCNCYILVQIKL